MLIDIRVPEAGESITQVELARWLVTDGQYVKKDQEIAEIDSDKATLTINAEQAGVIHISLEEGSNTEPGKIIGTIDTSQAKPDTAPDSAESDLADNDRSVAPAQATAEKPGSTEPSEEKPKTAHKENPDQDITFSPQAQKLLDDLAINTTQLTSNPDGKRITKKDILAAISAQAQGNSRSITGKASAQKDESMPDAPATWGGGRLEERQKMSTLRRKIAERLVAVKNQTAMLTTFNEVDMSAIMELRAKYQDAFVKKYGYKLGFMSFFAKAIAESIPYFPGVNGYIDGGHIVYPAYADIGIAVSTPKGLMVPVIRNAEAMHLAELEEKIQLMAAKAREGKISLEELTGGTISITNGGVFGSMLSTPILNPPQSAILGMHNIIERPVAIDGKVVIRPMMYLALSYDHRIVDGKESVSFLVKVKEMIENPALMALQGKSAESILLGL